MSHASAFTAIDELAARFDETWRSNGSTEHGYAEDYRRIARRLVDVVIETNIEGGNPGASSQPQRLDNSKVEPFDKKSSFSRPARTFGKTADEA